MFVAVPPVSRTGSPEPRTMAQVLSQCAPNERSKKEGEQGGEMRPRERALGSGSHSTLHSMTWHVSQTFFLKITLGNMEGIREKVRT